MTIVETVVLEFFEGDEELMTEMETEIKRMISEEEIDYVFLDKQTEVVINLALMNIRPVELISNKNTVLLDREIYMSDGKRLRKLIHVVSEERDVRTDEILQQLTKEQTKIMATLSSKADLYITKSKPIVDKVSFWYDEEDNTWYKSVVDDGDVTWI